MCHESTTLYVIFRDSTPLSIGDTHTIENSGERYVFWSSNCRVVWSVELWASRCRVVRATRDVVVATSLCEGQGGVALSPCEGGW